MGVNCYLKIEFYVKGVLVKKYYEGCSMYVGSFDLEMLDIPPGVDKVVAKWRNQYDPAYYESDEEEEEEEGEGEGEAKELTPPGT